MADEVTQDQVANPQLTVQDAEQWMKETAEQTADVKLPFEMQAPSSDTPGYLRRMREIIKFQSAVSGGELTETALEDLIDFLILFVTSPADRVEAEELVWDLSENQFMKALTMVSGGGVEEAQVPPQS